MFSFAPTNAFLPVIDRYIYLVTYINYNGVMLYKIAINNTIHIPFLRKYFGFSFFNALPPPPPVLQGGAKPLQGGHCLICPPVCHKLRQKGKKYMYIIYDISKIK